MARRSRTQITKALALSIASKLDAEIDHSGGAHDLASVYHKGVVVAQFGIRRGSQRDAGHDHIPRDIFVGTGFAKRLGQCTKEKVDWVQSLIASGIITPEEDDRAS